MLLDFFAYFFVFIFGLCIGSFLNVIIYRLEEEKKVFGRSFCPQCKKQIKWYDLIPIFSFLFLKGECRFCHKKISVQYPLIELVTGILFTIIFCFFGFNWLVGFNIFALIKILFLFYIFSSLIIIFVFDLKHYLIPEAVLFPAIGITFIYQLTNNFSFAFFDYLLAGALASLFFGLIFFISKGKWMGFGDVELAFLMGLLLGSLNVVVALFLAFIFGAIIGIILMILQQKNIKSEIPFGPFLILGTFVSILLGGQLILMYLNLFALK